MTAINAKDFYKTDHHAQYPEGTEFVYTNWTPRSARIAQRANPGFFKDGKIVNFGNQGFVLDFLVKEFADTFFDVPEYKAVNRYKRRLDTSLGPDSVSVENIRALHRLGYLPLRIKALPEGARVGERVPVMTMVNTLPAFGWLPNALETVYSSENWQPSTSATIAYEFYRTLMKYAERTGAPKEFVPLQGHDFSYRGMAGTHAAAKSGSGHLLSFVGTDTIPAIDYLEDNYRADSEKELVGCSVPATEHSVMCMGGMKDEIGTFRRLINELYPTGIISIVSDTWDWWKVVTVFMPILKDEIMARQPNALGLNKVVLRPDCYDEQTSIMTPKGWVLFKDLKDSDTVAQVLEDGTFEYVIPSKRTTQYYEGDMCKYTDHHGKVDLMVTPNHRMILEQRNKISGDWNTRTVEAEKLIKPNKKGHAGQRFTRSAASSIRGNHLSSLERLKIAFQADGSFVTKSKKNIRFSFAKQRKMDRLEVILAELPFVWTKYDLSDNRVEYNINVLEASDFQKEFDWVNTSQLGSLWSQEFIEELSYWDATRRSDERFKFDTTNAKVIPVVELIALNAGYGILVSKTQDDRSDKFSDVYTAHILVNNTIGGQAVTKEVVPYEGNVYCVTVPSGKLLVKRGRGALVCGNSGDPVRIIAGYKVDHVADVWTDSDAVEIEGKFYTVETTEENRNGWKPGKELTEAEVKGAVQCLWETFGGTETEKGYKMLDEHIGLIYGDSITLSRADKILSRLEEKGFASNNIVFGIGSFTYQYNTRDTFGWAMKATAGIINGEAIEIFKDPKTDSGVKKSAKGLLRVELENGEYVLYDQQTPAQEERGELKTMFLNGVTELDSLANIRNRLVG